MFQLPNSTLSKLILRNHVMHIAFPTLALQHKLLLIVPCKMIFIKLLSHLSSLFLELQACVFNSKIFARTKLSEKLFNQSQISWNIYLKNIHPYFTIDFNFEDCMACKK
ncbi:Hypothetical predicted protein [Octopus vulgaris]|uniref:Uncharacterized protein n=1 Tax=Octopus vulgaris TaxID=6645 RepID=A0AA36AKT6_OCTVU|nr:Hypothetical predicted protein [Octopus vulgaris]